jgi:hypothetical protein
MPEKHKDQQVANHGVLEFSFGLKPWIDQARDYRCMSRARESRNQ